MKVCILERMVNLYEKWMGMNKMDISKITQKLYLSGSIDNYTELKDFKIGVVVNCRAEQHDDVSELTKQGIAYFWIPINDWGPPRHDQIETFMRVCYSNPLKNILVHCTLGRGRSAFLAVVYMISTQKMDIKNAIEYVSEKRPGISLTDVQLKKLRKEF